MVSSVPFGSGNDAAFSMRIFVIFAAFWPAVSIAIACGQL